MKQLKESDIKPIREKILKKQKGKCAICDYIIEKDDQPCLDHQHFGDGLIRGVLCRACNTLDGQLYAKFKRSGLLKRFPLQQDYYTWLKKMLNYLENPPQQLIHPQHRAQDIKKFKRKSKHQQIDILKKLGAKLPKQFNKCTMSLLVKIYRKIK